MIDYEQIVNELEDEKIIKLMGLLGAGQHKNTPNALIFPTICHNEIASEASMKLYYYKDTHLFYCYTQDGAMSIFKFLKHYYETRNIDYDWYNDILQVVLNCAPNQQNYGSGAQVYQTQRSNYEQIKVRKQLPTFPNGLIDTFIKFYPGEWLDDGITKSTMDKYNIRFSPDQEKIIIPHYDINGNLVGVRGRALNEWEIENLGKYMPVQIEEKWYSHPLSLNLYGLNLSKENIKSNRICYIFEAEKSPMQFESFNLPNCAVACCGSKINKFQIDLLMRTCAPIEIVVCFDKEELPNETKYFKKLYQMCQKYKNYCNISFIYDRENLLNLKDSPTDKGEETFKKLLKGRVKIK